MSYIVILMSFTAAFPSIGYESTKQSFSHWICNTDEKNNKHLAHTCTLVYLFLFVLWIINFALTLNSQYYNIKLSYNFVTVDKIPHPYLHISQNSRFPLIQSRRHRITQLVTTTERSPYGLCLCQSCQQDVIVGT
jgi:hypothetical protein